MLTHAQIWSAIDRLADRHGLSPSGLARRAGLDPTSFNRSKRTSAEGRDRWPSTESVAKVLAATGSTLSDFVSLAEPDKTLPKTVVPLVGWAQAGAGRLFAEDGMPAGTAWEELEFPDLGPDKVFAVEVSGDSMAPLYRDGDVLIVSPTASIRRGDRVVVRTTEGEVTAKELKRRTAKSIELRSLNPEHPDRVLATDDVAWMARVMWVRQ